MGLTNSGAPITGKTAATADDSVSQFGNCGTYPTYVCSTIDDDKINDFKSLLSQLSRKMSDSTVADVDAWSAMQGLSSSPSGFSISNPLMQYHLSTSLEFNTGSTASTLSARNAETDAAYGGPEVVFYAGYSQLPNALAQGSIKVVGTDPTTFTVEAVTGTKNAVNVQYNSHVTSITEANGRVTVVTASGQTYSADYVICAVPLGVLKGADPTAKITFSPSFSSDRVNALDKIMYGNVHKMTTYFDTVFWPSSQYFGVTMSGEVGNNGSTVSTARGTFNYILNTHQLTQTKSLMSFGLGPSAPYIDKMTDSEAWTMLRTRLAGAFGDANVPAQPKNIIRSNWSGDKYAGNGVYSYAGIGAISNDWDAIAKPHGRVYFAGEHCNRKYRGTVHGAFLSGQAAAALILANSKKTSVGCGCLNAPGVAMFVPITVITSLLLY